MAKDEKIKQEIYVGSERMINSSYKIGVSVKGHIEGKYGYEYENNYTFVTNSSLTKISCTYCSDDKFFDIATEHAVEHMKNLKAIANKKFRKGVKLWKIC